MADNIDEEQLENSTNNQSENSPDEITPTADTETINPNQEAENMEVHHHAHHEGKKNWKSYFWEFLMLFLAVFCGFLAEYQLEHKIERDREKQYVESMLADIKEDAGKINKSIIYCTTQAAAFDSLLQNIYHTPFTDSSLRMMYYLQRRYTGNKETVAFTKRTITQLKNSGGLRLIRNKSASDSIIIYNETCETTEFQADYFVNVRLGKVNDFAIQLFNSQYLLNYDRYTVRDILQTDAKCELLNNDEKLIKEYANTIYHAKATLVNYIRMLKELESRIPGMVKFLENEYHIE